MQDCDEDPKGGVFIDSQSMCSYIPDPGPSATGTLTQVCRCATSPRPTPAPTLVPSHYCPSLDPDAADQTKSRTHLVNWYNPLLQGREVDKETKSMNLQYNVCYIEANTQESFELSLNALYKNCEPNNNCYSNVDSVIYKKITGELNMKSPLALHCPAPRSETHFTDRVNQMSMDICNCNTNGDFNTLQKDFNGSCKIPSDYSPPNAKISWILNDRGVCPIAEICNNICDFPDSGIGSLSKEVQKEVNYLCSVLPAVSCEGPQTMPRTFFTTQDGKGKYLAVSGQFDCCWNGTQCYPDEKKCPAIKDDHKGKLYPRCYLKEASGGKQEDPDLCITNDGNVPLNISLRKIFDKIIDQQKQFLLEGQFGMDYPALISSAKPVLEIHTPLTQSVATNLLTTKSIDVSNVWWLSSGLQRWGDSRISPIHPKYQFKTMYEYLVTLFRGLAEYNDNVKNHPILLNDLSGLFNTSSNKKGTSPVNRFLEYIPKEIITEDELLKYMLQILADNYSTDGKTWASFFGDAPLKWNFNVRDPNTLIQANLDDWQNIFNNQPIGYNDGTSVTNAYIPNGGTAKVTSGLPIYFESSNNNPPLKTWGQIDSSVIPPTSRWLDISGLISTSSDIEKLVKYKNNEWNVDISMYNTFQKYLIEDNFNNFDKGVTFFTDTSHNLPDQKQGDSIINKWFSEDHNGEDTLKILEAIKNSTKYSLWRNVSTLRQKCQPQVAKCSTQYNTPNTCIIPPTTRKKQASENVFFDCQDRDYNSLQFKLETYIRYVKQTLAGGTGKSQNKINIELLTAQDGWFNSIYPMWYWNDTKYVSWGSARKNESDKVLESIINTDNSLGGMPNMIPPPPSLVVKLGKDDVLELSNNNFNRQTNKLYSPYMKTIREYVKERDNGIYEYLLPSGDSTGNYWTLTYANDVDATATIKWHKDNPFNDILHYWVAVLVPACQGIINYDTTMKNDIAHCLNSSKTMLLQYSILDASSTLIFNKYKKGIYQCNDSCLNSFNNNYKPIDPSFQLFAMAKYETFLMLLFDGSFANGITDDKIKQSMKLSFSGDPFKDSFNTIFEKRYNDNFRNHPVNDASLSQNHLFTSSFRDISTGWARWYLDNSSAVPPNDFAEVIAGSTYVNNRIAYDKTNTYLQHFNKISQAYYKTIFSWDQGNLGYPDYLDTLSPNPIGVKFGIASLNKTDVEGTYLLPPTLYRAIPGCVYGMLENFRTNKLVELEDAMRKASQVDKIHLAPNINVWQKYTQQIPTTLNTLSQLPQNLVPPPLNLDIDVNDLYKSLYSSVCKVTMPTGSASLQLKPAILDKIADGAGAGLNDVSVNPLKIYSNLLSISKLYTDLSTSTDVMSIQDDITNLTKMKGVLKTTPFDATPFNMNMYIHQFVLDYTSQKFSATLADIMILFNQQLIPLLKFKYGVVLTDLYNKALKPAIVTYTNNMNTLRTGGTIGSAQPVLSKELGLRVMGSLKYSNPPQKPTDISYLTKYIFSFNHEQIPIPTTIDERFINDISYLDNVFTTYSNSFTLPAYGTYVENEKSIMELDLSYNYYLFQYAIKVSKETKVTPTPSQTPYQKMREYYQYAPSMEILTGYMNNSDTSMNLLFDNNLGSKYNSHDPEYPKLYNDLSSIYTKTNNFIKSTASQQTVVAISSQLQLAKTQTNDISTNCDTTSIGCWPMKKHIRLGIWLDLGKYSPLDMCANSYLQGWDTMTKFLAKNGAHNYNLAFSQTKILMLCVYAHYIYEESRTEQGDFTTSNNFFDKLVSTLGDPLASYTKDTIYPVFLSGAAAADKPDSGYSNMTNYNKAYNIYCNGFCSLKKGFNNHDPSGILGLSLGGELADGDTDNFLYSPTLTNYLATDSKKDVYTVINTVARHYKNLIYGTDVTPGCDTCDYDLENGGFWTNENAGGGIDGGNNPMYWYQFVFFNAVKNNLLIDGRRYSNPNNSTLTQKLTLLGDPTSITSIYNLISNGVHCFDAVNIMGYGNGTNWYVSAAAKLGGTKDQPVSFNVQAWLNVISSEWIDISRNTHGLDLSQNTTSTTLDKYFAHLDHIYDGYKKYKTMTSIFAAVKIYIQNGVAVTKYLKKHNMKFVRNKDNDPPGLADKLISNYQDNTNYYDYTKNSNDTPWSKSVTTRVKKWFGHDLDSGNKNTVGRAAWYVNFMWWVDTLAWARINVGTRTDGNILTYDQIKYKLTHCSEGVYFWLDTNRNSDANITKMNTSSLHLFATYQILQDGLFTTKLPGDNDEQWIDSVNTWVDISNNVMHDIISGNDSTTSGSCDDWDWRCKSSVWGKDNRIQKPWITRNIPTVGLPLHSGKILGGWSNTTQEGTWDNTLGCNTLCLGNFGSDQASSNFGAGRALIPTVFGKDSNVLEKIGKYTNRWYTIGGEGTKTISFGDQAFSRMALDIGGIWYSHGNDSSLVQFNSEEWKKLPGFSSSWDSSAVTLLHTSNQQFVKNSKHWVFPPSPTDIYTMQSYVELGTQGSQINWISDILTADISYNGLCFDTESTGSGPPWWQSGEYTDPFIRNLGYETWSQMEIGSSGMGSFQVYVARRWLNMWGDLLKQKIRARFGAGPFSFSCSPETGDALSEENLYVYPNWKTEKSYVMFNYLPAPTDSCGTNSSTGYNKLMTMVRNHGISNEPFDYLIPQMYNNNLAYKKWDPFKTETDDTIILGDCSDNLVVGNEQPHWAQCSGNKFKWKSSAGVSPSDVIKKIAGTDVDRGGWPASKIILTFESAAAYMYTFDPSIVVDFSYTVNGYSNIITGVSGDVGIKNGWESDCIGTKNTSNWTQSFQDPSGLFWQNLRNLIEGTDSTLNNAWTGNADSSGFAGILGWPAQEEGGQLFPAVDGLNILKLLTKQPPPTPAPSPPTPAPPTPKPTPDPNKVRCINGDHASPGVVCAMGGQGSSIKPYCYVATGNTCWNYQQVYGKWQCIVPQGVACTNSPTFPPSPAPGPPGPPPAPGPTPAPSPASGPTPVPSSPNDCTKPGSETKCDRLDPNAFCGPASDPKAAWTDGTGCACDWGYIYSATAPHCTNSSDYGPM
jgi:hypothetical protein